VGVLFVVVGVVVVVAGCVVVVGCVVVDLLSWEVNPVGMTETAPTPALGVVVVVVVVVGFEVGLLRVWEVIAESDGDWLPESGFLTSGTVTPIIMLLPISLPFRSANTTLACSVFSYLTKKEIKIKLTKINKNK